MKVALLSSAVLLCVTIIAVFSQSVTPDDPDKIKMDAIGKRVRSGEKRAILEEANVKPDISVPVLAMTVRDRTMDPEKAELARQSLTQIKGVEDYLKDKIDRKYSGSDEHAIEMRGNQMEILAMVRTNKAIRIIASYLFDDKNPGYFGSDYSIASNKFEAAILLDEMKFPQAPSTLYKSDNEHVNAWRTWWLKNQSQFGDGSPYRGNN